MPYIDIFILNVKELLQDNNLNYKQFAGAIFCSTSMVSKWLDGTYYPKIVALVRIADYFGCTIDYLYGRGEDAPKRIAVEKTFAQQLSAIMEKEKITNYRLAKEAGIQPSTVSKWLLHNRIPETETLIKLADVLDCSIDYLAGISDR